MEFIAGLEFHALGFDIFNGFGFFCYSVKIFVAAANIFHAIKIFFVRNKNFSCEMYNIPKKKCNFT